MHMRTIALAIAATLVAGSALAAEQEIKLKQGPGLDKVEANCAACHSLAYIPMNSPFLNAAGWDAAVNKMINALKAPIDEADAKAIKEYLAKNYGT
jgi:mono/diheme cytochrome c family protein